jgi:hypothetical protein
MARSPTDTIRVLTLEEELARLFSAVLRRRPGTARKRPSAHRSATLTRCGIIGADARPNWLEQPQRESLTGVQWR